jgi:hypothetical protein
METKYLYKRARSRIPYLTAKQALEKARAYIAGPLTQYHADMERWQAEGDKRRYAPGGIANRPKFPQFFACPRDPTPLDGLRDCGNVDEIFPRLFDHRGWFSDVWKEDTYRGHVWQLPARDGQCQYLAGYVEPSSGYPVLCRNDDGSIEIFTADPSEGDKPEGLKDAARAADSLAERNAEKEREHSERWHEAQKASEARDEARDDLRKARADASLVIAALRQQRAQGVAPMVCDLLRTKMQECRDEMRAAIESISEHTDRIESLGMQGEF